MDAHELASCELLLELVDAMNRRLEASFVGDEPDIVAVRLGETDLGPPQQDHALAGQAHDARRRAQPGLGPLVLDPVTVFRSEDRKAPDGLVGQKDRAQRDPAGLAAELGHDLRRADPAVVETSLRDGVTGEAPEVQARLPANCGIHCRHPRGDAEEEACPLVGDDDLAARIQGSERLAGPRSGLGECRGQFGAAVAGALTQDRTRAADCVGQPPGCLGRKVGAPGRDVEDRNGIASHGVANGHAGTNPLVKAGAPVLGPADQHRSGCLERRAHPVRACRPLRPARPRRHVAVPRAEERLLVALDGQDPPRTVGDCDDAADPLDLARDRRRGAAELGEHDLVFERLLGGRLVVRGRRRCLTQTRVDVVLLAAAIPRRGHLGPDPTNAVVPRDKPFTRCRYGLVPLGVTHAMALCGLAHVGRGFTYHRRLLASSLASDTSSSRTSRPTSSDCGPRA
jgi:hypothetical protein